MSFYRHSIIRDTELGWSIETMGLRVPVPGARDMTVGEYVGDRIRHAQRYGRWIEIPRDVAHENDELRSWCRRHCNSELPSGDFRFPAARWQELSRASIGRLPFIPQFDHPDTRIRKLAEYEFNRRVAEGLFSHWNAERQKAVRDAVAAGHTLREIARLLGISFGRVRQIRDGLSSN
jgi:DNA-directed RNA polymerase specialized sigma24 family protein